MANRKAERETNSQKQADAAMQSYGAGEDAAYGEVHEYVAPRVFGYLVRQVRDRSRAEDLLQQTLLHLHRARGTFVPGMAVLPWVLPPRYMRS